MLLLLLLPCVHISSSHALETVSPYDCPNLWRPSALSQVLSRRVICGMIHFNVWATDSSHRGAPWGNIRPPLVLLQGVVDWLWENAGVTGHAVAMVTAMRVGGGALGMVGGPLGRVGVGGGGLEGVRVGGGGLGMVGMGGGGLGGVRVVGGSLRGVEVGRGTVRERRCSPGMHVLSVRQISSECVNTVVVIKHA